MSIALKYKAAWCAPRYMPSTCCHCPYNRLTEYSPPLLPWCRGAWWTDWHIIRLTIVHIFFLLNFRSLSILAADGTSMNVPNVLLSQSVVYHALDVSSLYKLVARSLFYYGVLFFISCIAIGQSSLGTHCKITLLCSAKVTSTVLHFLTIT